jgi:hypothetical protein
MESFPDKVGTAKELGIGKEVVQVLEMALVGGPHLIHSR